MPTTKKIGDKFSHWTIIEPNPDALKPKKGYWFCRCVCGTERWVSGNSLAKGLSTSCGCKAHEKAKKTWLKNHGTDNPSKSAQIQEKKKQTCIKNYGTDNPSKSPEIQRKKEETCIKNYGTDNPSKSAQVQEKKKQTCIKNYGTDNPSKSPEVREKMQKTTFERHGYVNTMTKGKNIMMSDGTPLYNYVKSKIGHYAPQAYKIFHKNGESTCIEYLENYNHDRMNGLEGFFANLIPEAERWDKFPQKGVSCRPDFKLTDTFFVNVDGLYWHSEHRRPNNYHKQIRDVMAERGYELFQFREDEVFDKADIVRSMILNKLGKVSRIGARKCKVVDVSASNASDFLESNHLMGSGQRLPGIGLELDGELICLGTFKKHGEGIELIRFCTKLHTSVQGGLSRILSAATKKYNDIKCITSFVDQRYGDGQSLTKVGFVKIGVSVGWKWTDFQTTYNRLKCRANMDSRMLSQQEYADELGWHKIYDAGQAKFILILNR